MGWGRAVAAAEPTSLDRGRYRLHGVVGRGGSAVVYRASDAALRREVAVKLLDVDGADQRRRFFREAETMSRLDHPNIVRLFDFGEDGGRCFMVMELLMGGSVGRGLRKYGAMTQRAAAELMLPVLDGLEYAHQQGVVHRDVKPTNLLLTLDGVPKLADFGIARLLGAPSLTGTNAVMGSWPFMAPEQRLGARHADARSDVFSAGAVLWGLCRRAEPKDIYVPQRRAVLLQGFAPTLAAIITHATQGDPEERVQSAAELREALGFLVSALPDQRVQVRASHERASTFDFDEG